MLEMIIKYNENPKYASLHVGLFRLYIVLYTYYILFKGTTSNLDCTLDVNVKLGHDSFPEVWVDVYL